MKSSLPSAIEPLEARIAPAMASLLFLNDQTATYTDVDGDAVTVKVSKGKLDVINFNGDPSGGMGGDQLKELNLGFGLTTGVNVTITAVPVGSGDGFVNVGSINGAGLDLGAVTVHGDLGKIVAGDGTTTSAGVKSLTVQSFGAFGMTTGAPDLNSSTNGALGALTVKGSMVDAAFKAIGGVDGKIGSVTIGVSLDSGKIESEGDMGKVKIGKDVIGGSGVKTGSIISGGKMASVTVTGTLFGGGAADTGSIHSAGDMGKVFVGGDVQGLIGDRSGSIISDKKMGDVFVGGSLFGSILISNTFSHTAFISSGLDMGKVTIMQEVVGSGTPFSGLIQSGGNIASVTVGGSVFGGVYDHSGRIESVGNIGKVKIGVDLVGGSASSPMIVSGTPNQSGTISAKDIGSLAIGGSLIGGDNLFNVTLTDSGMISATNIKLLTIGGSFTGGAVANGTLNHSGYISVTGAIKTLSITDDMFGGAVTGSGTSNGGAAVFAGSIDKMSIGGFLKGTNVQGTGLATNGGIVSAATTIKQLTIGSSFIGGFANDGSMTRSGYITAPIIKSLSITGDVSGDDTSNALPIDGSAAVVADHIDKLFIGGAMITTTTVSGAGANTHTTSINVANDIGSLTIRGGLEGNANNPVIISARGQATPSGTKNLAIGNLNIGADVAFANILAGYNTSLAPTNGDAQIGKVSVIGNWTASNLVAGAYNPASSNVKFGDANDMSIGSGSPTIFTAITSINIGGTVTGTTGGSDHYGFVAHLIGKFTLGGTIIPLEPAGFTRDFGPAPSDVSIHLI